LAAQKKRRNEKIFNFRGWINPPPPSWLPKRKGGKKKKIISEYIVEFERINHIRG